MEAIRWNLWVEPDEYNHAIDTFRRLQNVAHTVMLPLSTREGKAAKISRGKGALTVAYGYKVVSKSTKLDVQMYSDRFILKPL